MKSLSSRVFSIPFFINRRILNPIQIVTILGLVSERSCYFRHSYLSNRARYGEYSCYFCYFCYRGITHYLDRCKFLPPVPKARRA
jgi:hypothetical protein